MNWTRIFLIFTAIFFVARTFFRSFGRKSSVKEQNFDVLVSSISCFCVFCAIKIKIFLLLALLTPIFFYFSRRERQHQTSEDTFCDVLDQILLNMRTGMSFEMAQKNVAMTCFLSTNDQEEEFARVLNLCSDHATQAFHILSTFKYSLSLRSRLSKRQDAISLHARAQSIVSGFLFVGLFLAEVYLMPNFSGFLASNFGKLAMTFSVCLVFGGIRWVFVIARPKEIAL